jgi:hypothetical protein
MQALPQPGCHRRCRRAALPAVSRGGRAAGRKAKEADGRARQAKAITTP